MRDAADDGHRQLVGPMVGKGVIGMACSWLRRSGDGSDPGPNFEGLGPCGSILNGWNLAAAEQEEVIDPIVSRREPLRLTG